MFSRNHMSNTFEMEMKTPGRAGGPIDPRGYRQIGQLYVYKYMNK